MSHYTPLLAVLACGHTVPFTHWTVDHLPRALYCRCCDASRECESWTERVA